MAQLAHHVFFTLHDRSDKAIDGLITAAQKYLTGHPGTISFAVGRRVPDLARKVNDVEFDVSLHVVFAERAAHDAYQQAERHNQFIAEQSQNWAEARVFDSYLTENPS